jgi:hypothetical protein
MVYQLHSLRVRYEDDIERFDLEAEIKAYEARLNVILRFVAEE